MEEPPKPIRYTIVVDMKRPWRQTSSHSVPPTRKSIIEEFSRALNSGHIDYLFKAHALKPTNKTGRHKIRTKLRKKRRS